MQQLPRTTTQFLLRSRVILGLFRDVNKKTRNSRVVHARKTRVFEALEESKTCEHRRHKRGGHTRHHFLTPPARLNRPRLGLRTHRLQCPFAGSGGTTTPALPRGRDIVRVKFKIKCLEQKVVSPATWNHTSHSQDVLDARYSMLLQASFVRRIPEAQSLVACV